MACDLVNFYNGTWNSKRKKNYKFISKILQIFQYIYFHFKNSGLSFLLSSYLYKLHAKKSDPFFIFVFTLKMLSPISSTPEFSFVIVFYPVWYNLLPYLVMSMKICFGWLMMEESTSSNFIYRHTLFTPLYAFLSQLMSMTKWLDYPPATQEVWGLNPRRANFFVFNSWLVFFLVDG